MDPENKAIKFNSLSEEKISRRTFLDWVIQGGLAATALAMLAPALAYIWPVTKRGPAVSQVDAGPLEDIPVGDSKKVVVAGSPVLLIRTAEGVKAFSAICTHLGCLVGYDGAQGKIVCPCHAGMFNLEGRVLSGPPPKPLPIYQASVVDGRILIKP